MGQQRARYIASAFGRVKPGGGGLYANEAGAVFGPVQLNGTWLDAFVGTVPDDWFAS